MIAVSIGLPFMIYILFRYRELSDLLLISIHHCIRSIIDIKYDLVTFEGREKNMLFMKLLVLNFGQMRLLFDLFTAFRTEAVFSMSLMMSQVVDALLKRVPQSIICVRRLYIALRGDISLSEFD